RIDPWFLHSIATIVRVRRELKQKSPPFDEATLRKAKELGFSDRKIGELTRAPRGSVRAERKRLGIVPHLAQIDTLAAEWPAETNYLYSSYHARATDTAPSWRKKVMVLGSGAYRIGSSVGVGFGCVNPAAAARELADA